MNGKTSNSGKSQAAGNLTQQSQRGHRFPAQTTPANPSPARPKGDDHDDLAKKIYKSHALKGIRGASQNLGNWWPQNHEQVNPSP